MTKMTKSIRQAILKRITKRAFEKEAHILLVEWAEIARRFYEACLGEDAA